METRNILDILGNIIGTLEMPDGTSEAAWAEKLAGYNTAVVNTANAIVDTIKVSATSTTTTSSSSASTIEGMFRTPPAGKYLIDFNGSIYTAGASAVGEFGIYVNNVLIEETRRDISCNLQLLGGLVTVSLNSIGIGTLTGTEITLDGTQIVEVKFRSTNGGTIGFKERVMKLIKVA